VSEPISEDDGKEMEWTLTALNTGGSTVEALFVGFLTFWTRTMEFEKVL